MGQRHQIYVKIANPLLYIPNLVITKELRKEFGTGKYSILTYHNQWLFGRGAIANAMRLLSFASQFTREQKTDVKCSFGGYDSPICPRAMESNQFDIEKIINLIGIIMNLRPVNTDWLSAGVDNSFYIGKEDEGINFDFTRGDNNDGITIIDMVENKYCFMNINGYSKRSHSASQLPNLKPVDAKRYVTAYYAEKVSQVNPYYLERGKAKHKTPEQVVKSLTRINKKALRGFDKFEVLTQTEIEKMFKRMFKKKEVKELV